MVCITHHSLKFSHTNITTNLLSETTYNFSSKPKNKTCKKMLVSVVLALFLPCAGMSAIFLVYICLLWYAASRNNRDQDAQFPVKSNKEKGLSASDLEKLPKVTGKDLVLGTDCAVCLDDIESDQPARLVPGCNHGFHLQCADTWLSKNSICPVCRAKLPPELFDPPESNPC